MGSGYCYCGNGMAHLPHDEQIKLREERDRLLFQVDELKDRVQQLHDWIVAAKLPIPQPNYVFKPRVPVPACDHDWQELGDSAKALTHKCRRCDLLK